MSQKSGKYWIGVIVSLVIGILSNQSVEATEALQAPESGVYHTRGVGEVPTPFEGNELLDGDVYEVRGQVFWPFIRVTARKGIGDSSDTYKFYLLEGTTSQWRKWDHSEITLVCRAHWRKVLLEDEQFRYVISLEPLEIIH